MTISDLENKLKLKVYKDPLHRRCANVHTYASTTYILRNPTNNAFLARSVRFKDVGSEVTSYFIQSTVAEIKHIRRTTPGTYAQHLHFF